MLNIGDRIVVHNTKDLKYPKYMMGRKGVFMEHSSNGLMDFVIVKFDGDDFRTIIGLENIKKDEDITDETY